MASGRVGTVGGNLVRRKVVTSATANMGTLLADLKSQSQLADQTARQAAADTSQAWAGKADELKALAQNVVDGTSTAAEYKAAVDDATKTFPDKSGLLSANLDSVLKAADTTRFNDYTAGGLSFDAWKSYVSDRNNDGAGQGALGTLVARAQKNEDTVNYNSYIKGDASYADWQSYVATRQKSGGNLVDLQTLDAQALHNEDRANDRRNQIAYNAGTLDPTKYQQYISDRISNASNPDDLTSLKAEQSAVASNEFNKSVNAIIDGQQSGRFSLSDALTQLNALKSHAPDAAAQASLLNRIAAYQKQDVAQGGAGTSALKSQQTEIDKLITDAQSLFDKSVTNARTDAKDGGDPSSALRAIQAAYAQMNFAYSQAAQFSTDPNSAAHYGSVLAGQQQALSTDLRQATSLAAGTARMSAASKGLTPTEASQRATDLLLQGSANPALTPQDQLGLIHDARQLYSEVQGNIGGSANSANARSTIQNIADGITALADPAKKQATLDALLKLGGGTANNIGDAVRAALLKDPGAVYNIAKGAGLDEFQGRDAAGYQTQTLSQFTRQWQTDSNELQSMDSFATHFTNNLRSVVTPSVLSVMGPQDSDLINFASTRAGRQGSLGAGPADVTPTGAPATPTTTVTPASDVPTFTAPNPADIGIQAQFGQTANPFASPSTAGRMVPQDNTFTGSPQSPDAQSRNASLATASTPMAAAPVQQFNAGSSDGGWVMPSFTPMTAVHDIPPVDIGGTQNDVPPTFGSPPDTSGMGGGGSNRLE